MRAFIFLILNFGGFLVLVPANCFADNCSRASADKVYQIHNVEQFVRIFDSCVGRCPPLASDHIALCVDLDLQGVFRSTSAYVRGIDFPRINPGGSFDGNGHTLKNLNSSWFPLVEFVPSDATFENLNVKGAKLKIKESMPVEPHIYRSFIYSSHGWVRNLHFDDLRVFYPHPFDGVIGYVSYLGGASDLSVELKADGPISGSMIAASDGPLERIISRVEINTTLDDWIYFRGAVGRVTGEVSDIYSFLKVKAPMIYGAFSISDYVFLYALPGIELINSRLFSDIEIEGGLVGEVSPIGDIFLGNDARLVDANSTLNVVADRLSGAISGLAFELLGGSVSDIESDLVVKAKTSTFDHSSPSVAGLSYWLSNGGNPAGVSLSRVAANGQITIEDATRGFQMGGLVTTKVWADLAVSDSYSRIGLQLGAVPTSGPSAVVFGGAVGYNGSSSLLLNRVYAANSIVYPENSSRVFAGGLISPSSDSDDIAISSSYWDKDLSGVEISVGGGEARTTEEMFDEATYLGWDFDKTWTIKNSYPLLRGQSKGNT